MLRALLGIGVVFAVAVPVFVSAHEARFVSVGQHDVTVIEDPERSQAFYGNLDDNPHLFEIHSEQQFELFVEILEPDTSDAAKELAGIVFKRNRRGVEEITRLSWKEASWESFYEWFGGDTYRRGPSFTTTLEPGNYAIEVSTPENKGKYVLVVGKREVWNISSYFSTLGDIMKIKTFFGKPRILVIESPFVYVPFGLIVVLGGLLYLRRKRRAIS